MIEWRTIPRDRFDRLAEQLIRRSVEEEHPGLEVKAIDGRGGDGGIDLDVRARKSQQLVRIYQLKWFPEGFSGEWARSRKPQITGSYNKALEHSPPVWYLVVPRNLTVGERKFVRALRGKNKRIEVRYLGATELDALLVKYPDIDDWAQRDSYKSALEMVNRSTAALSGPGDLGSEVMDLARRVRPRSDYWDIDFKKEGDQYSEEYVALRPDSMEREPLSFSVVADFTGNEGLQAQFDDAMEFGVVDPIVLPDGVIKSFERHGPEWFAGKEVGGSLELHSVPHYLEGEVSVALLTASGRQVARRIARTARFVRGANGGRLFLDLGDGLKFIFQMERNDSPEGELNAGYEISGLTGAQAKRALRFIIDLSKSSTVVLDFEDRVSKMRLENNKLEPNIFTVELADDLAFIEDELGVEFKFANIEEHSKERVWIRVIRRILEGRVSLVPESQGMDFVFSGEVNDALARLLSSGGGFSSTTEVWQTTLLGQTIEIEDVSVLLADGVVVDGAEHLLALQQGNGAGRTATIKSRDDKLGLIIWSTSRIGDLETLSPTPWGLTGIKEHLRLREAE